MQENNHVSLFSTGSKLRRNRLDSTANQTYHHMEKKSETFVDMNTIKQIQQICASVVYFKEQLSLDGLFTRFFFYA